MTAKEIIRTLMGEQNKSNADMAQALGISQAALWDRLNPEKSNNMTVKKLNEMLSQLGYEVAVVPRGGANRIKGAYRVDDGGKETKPSYDLDSLLSTPTDTPKEKKPGKIKLV